MISFPLKTKIMSDEVNTTFIPPYCGGFFHFKKMSAGVVQMISTTSHILLAIFVLFFKYFGPLLNKGAVYISLNNTKYNRRHYFNTQRFSSLVQLSVYSNKLVLLLFLHGCREAAVHSLADFQCHEKVIVCVKLLSRFPLKPIKKIQSCSSAGAKLKDWQRSHLRKRKTQLLS